MEKEKKIKLNICDEVKYALKKSRIVQIVGEVKSGKSTLSANISELKGRHVKIVSPHHEKVDEELYGMYDDFEMLPKGAKTKSRLDGLKGITIIWDDAQALTRSQKEYLDGLLINVREEKQDLHLIIIHHLGRKVSLDVLSNTDSFLIVKAGSNFKSQKINQYFTVQRIGVPAVELCNKLKGFENIYFCKSGKFALDDNEVDIIQPKSQLGTLKYDYNEIIEFLRQGNSVEETADEFNCSKNTIYKYIQRQRITEPEFYTFRRGVKNLGQEFGFRREGTLSLVWNHDCLHEGKAIEDKKRKIHKYKHNEMIGDKATIMVGKEIYACAEQIMNGSPKKYINIEISTNKEEGDDVTIRVPKRQIEIEIKNWKDKIYPSHVEGSDKKLGIKDKFSASATDRWLFTCGAVPTKKAKKLLKDYRIEYLKLTGKQLNGNNSGQNFRVKKKVRDWFKLNIREGEA